MKEGVKILMGTSMSWRLELFYRRSDNMQYYVHTVPTKYSVQSVSCAICHDLYSLPSNTSSDLPQVIAIGN